ncbi:hypothetical protein TNCV_2287471 [Trichonephila clavipes]|nr:hypothetical protein TNCV_2287471 [Trichonephila clavipes]
MINEPVKPHHAVTFGGMQWLLCVLTWIRGRSNATVMVVNVTMKREMSFICPQDVKNPGGTLFHFREGPLRKCFSLCRICWQKFMARLQFVWVQLEDSTKNNAER